jgi:proteasome lid subunit RPN8/RPN11
MLHLPSNAKRSIERAAIASTPNECCGILVGRIHRRVRAVEQVVMAENVSQGDRTRGYEIDPQTAFDTIRAARKDDRQVIGFFHSHPDGSQTPSQRDIREAWPQKSYLIVAIKDGCVASMTSWRLNDRANDMIEEPIQSPLRS